MGRATGAGPCRHRIHLGSSPVSWSSNRSRRACLRPDHRTRWPSQVCLRSASDCFAVSDALLVLSLATLSVLATVVGTRSARSCSIRRSARGLVGRDFVLDLCRPFSDPAGAAAGCGASRALSSLVEGSDTTRVFRNQRSRGARRCRAALLQGPDLRCGADCGISSGRWIRRRQMRPIA